MNTTKTKVMWNWPEMLNMCNEQIEQVSEYKNRKFITKLSFVLRKKTIKQHLKTKVFDQCVLHVLTLGCQTCTFTNRFVQKFKNPWRNGSLAGRKAEWIREIRR